MSDHHLATLRPLAAGLLIASLLSACGGGGSSDATDATTGAVAADAATTAVSTDSMSEAERYRRQQASSSSTSSSTSTSASSTTSTTATGTAAATTTASTTTAAALAVLSPTDWEGDGQDVSYSGQTITGSDGVARAQKFADGTYLMRTVQGDPKNWSGNRSEFGWSGKMAMNPGTDYWFAFAFKPLSWGGGRQIFWQVHQDTGTQPSGCNGPTLELQLADGALQINSVTGSSSEWTCNSLLNSTTYAPAVGQWSNFVVHFRPGYLASQSPKTEVWKDGVLVYSSTNINTQPNANDYAKIGIYKWDDSWAGVNERAAYYSPLYFGTGTDLKANADASISAY